MEAIWDIIGKVAIVMSILLNILVSLKWFRELNNKNEATNKVIIITRVFSLVFIGIYIISDLHYYVGQIIQGGKEHTLLKTLFLSFE